MKLGSKTLLEHQVAGVEWMKHRESVKRGRGGLLCDEMGLGKTITTLGLCATNYKETTLLLCPLAVMGQWREAAEDAGFAVSMMTAKGWKNPGADFFIANYDKVIARNEHFRQSWGRLILDEAHLIRNRKSAKYEAIFKLKRGPTWCLTATPIVNSHKDMHALLSLVNPIIPSKSSMEPWVADYCLQRSVAQLRDSLPVCPKAVKTEVMALDFHTKEEATFYREIHNILQTNLEEALLSHENNMTQILAILLRLRQISIHPQIYIDAKRKQYGDLYARQDWTGDSAKFYAMKQLLHESKERHDWVVFCQFHKEMELLKESLEKDPMVGSVQMYSGLMSSKEREAVVQHTKEYKGEKHQVLLLQIHCGGVGLNLQHMDRVAFLSPWWTAALMDQAVGRVQRIGQKRSVVVYHLRLKEEEMMNIDHFILEKVDHKRELCQEFLEYGLHCENEDELKEALKEFRATS